MKNYSFIICLFFCSVSFAQTPFLSLQEAIQIAMKNNYDITIVKNEVDIGKLNNSWANTNLVPLVNGTLNNTLASNNLEQELSNGTTTKRDGASQNNLNAGVGFTWQFFDGFRMFATKNRLEELEKIGELNFKKMTNETIYDVIAAYYNIVRLKRGAFATKEIIGLYEERLKIAEAKFRIGTSPKPDFLQAQVDLNEQKSSLLNIENAIAVANTTLNTLLARDVTTPFDTPDSFDVRKPVDIATIQQKMDTQNPDLLLAQSNLAVLLQTKKEINSQRLPTATLNGNYNFTRNKNSAGFTLLNQTYGPSAGIGINVPIIRGTIVKRQLKVADINIKNQDLAIQQLKQQLQSSLTTSYLNYNNALKLAELELANLELVKENNYINMERFKKLSITSIELRQGQLNYVDGQTRLINAQYDVKLAEAELLMLSGQLAE